MNTKYSTGTGILGGLLCLALSLCSVEWNGTGQFASRRPGAESKWNNVGVWKKVGENPPTYLPRECSTKVLRVSSRGSWITDKRDGKRFFIPAGGSGGLSESVLCGDARKHCDPPPMILFKREEIPWGELLGGAGKAIGGMGGGGIGDFSISPGSISCPGGMGGGCAPSGGGAPSM